MNLECLDGVNNFAGLQQNMLVVQGRDLKENRDSNTSIVKIRSMVLPSTG